MVRMLGPTDLPKETPPTTLFAVSPITCWMINYFGNILGFFVILNSRRDDWCRVKNDSGGRDRG